MRCGATDNRASLKRGRLALRLELRSLPRDFPPGEQPLDALAHVDLGLPAEGALGERVIHLPGAARSQADLARLRLHMFGLQVLAGELRDEAHDLERRGRARPRDI